MECFHERAVNFVLCAKWSFGSIQKCEYYYSLETVFGVWPEWWECRKWRCRTVCGVSRKIWCIGGNSDTMFNNERDLLWNHQPHFADTDGIYLEPAVERLIGSIDAHIQFWVCEKFFILSNGGFMEAVILLDTRKYLKLNGTCLRQ